MNFCRTYEGLWLRVFNRRLSKSVLDHCIIPKDRLGQEQHNYLQLSLYYWRFCNYDDYFPWGERMDGISWLHFSSSSSSLLPKPLLFHRLILLPYFCPFFLRLSRCFLLKLYIGDFIQPVRSSGGPSLFANQLIALGNLVTVILSKRNICWSALDDICHKNLSSKYLPSDVHTNTHEFLRTLFKGI